MIRPFLSGAGLARALSDLLRCPSPIYHARYIRGLNLWTETPTSGKDWRCDRMPATHERWANLQARVI